jgi:hypothetical protein
METKSPDEEIIEVWRTLSYSQKQSVIHLIHTFQDDQFFLAEEEVENYNKEIEEAEQRIAEGKFTTHEQALKGFDKWK